MEKPKKKILHSPIRNELESHENYVHDGYNQAIDDFDAWLPEHDEEIKQETIKEIKKNPAKYFYVYFNWDKHETEVQPLENKSKLKEIG